MRGRDDVEVAAPEREETGVLDVRTTAHDHDVVGLEMASVGRSARHDPAGRRAQSARRRVVSGGEPR